MTKKKSVGVNTRQGILVHYTASFNLDQTVSWLSVGPQSKVSCHFVIGVDGSVHQIGNLTDVLWHAGVSSFSWVDANGEKHHLSSLNSHSIGIELMNPGPLTKKGSNFYTWWGEKIESPNLVHQIDGEYFIKYTDIQLKALEDLCLELIESNPTIKFVTGHQNVAPKRKVDPGNGKIFDERFYSKMARVINEREATEVTRSYRAKVKTLGAPLRVRSLPSITGDVVKTLPNGLFVDVKEAVPGWARIGPNQWVSDTYLELAH
jgi:N-acetylmuramoyl-L-alanine amidase